MPGATMAGFRRNSMIIAKAGIYDLRLHHDDVIMPVLRHWNVFDRTDFGPEGEQARARSLAAFLEALDEQATKFVDRREENRARDGRARRRGGAGHRRPERRARADRRHRAVRRRPRPRRRPRIVTPAASGTRLIPNQVLPSHRRIRASEAIGSFSAPTRSALTGTAYGRRSSREVAGSFALVEEPPMTERVAYHSYPTYAGVVGGASIDQRARCARTHDQFVAARASTTAMYESTRSYPEPCTANRWRQSLPVR